LKKTLKMEMSDSEMVTLGRMAYILWVKMKNKFEINLKFVSHFIGVIYSKRN
jgi:hypothetical protein